MKFLLFSMIATIPMLVSASTKGTAANDPLVPLKMRVGTWIVKSTHKKAAWTPKTRTISGVETAKWVLGGTFIQGASEVKSDGIKSLWMMNYDKDAKVYRLWYFDNKNAFPLGNSIGRWDRKSKALTWTMDIGNGNRGRGLWKYIDNDNFSWSMTIHDRDGKLAMDMTGTATRKK